MLGLPILDVAIGLIFVYPLMSVVVTALNELVAGLLNTRGKNLLAGVSNLVQNPAIAAKIFDHPLVRPLRRGDRMPSYMPPKIFARALMDTVALQQPGSDLGSRLKASVQGSTSLERVLRLMIEDAQDDVEKVKRALEEWFDDAMERVAGWYRRMMQWVSLAVALFATVALNVDSFAIANQLWREPALRTAVAAQATAYVQRVEMEAAQRRQEAAKDESKGGPAAPPAQLPYETTGETPQGRLEDAIAEIQGTGLAVGWTREAGGLPIAVRNHWLGWLLTALASSIGAPFWFDLLRK